MARLSVARFSFIATAIGTKVLFAGGFTAPNTSLDTVDIDDTATGQRSTSPGTASPILAGITLNFQAWFRDNAAGGAHFDLSNGLEIVFLP